MQNNYANPAEEYCYAGFWARLAAFVIDSIIVFAALLIVRAVLGLTSILFSEFSGAGSSLFNRALLFQFSLKDILLYLIKVAYFVILTYYTGCTFGKRALNLVVISRKTPDGRLGLFDAIYRETIGRYLSGFLLCLGYIMIGIGKEKCGLHDILCDTRVVYGKRIKLFGSANVNPQNRPVPNSGTPNYHHQPGGNPGQESAAAPDPGTNPSPSAENGDRRNMPPLIHYSAPSGPYSYVHRPAEQAGRETNPGHTASNRPNQPDYGCGPYQYGVKPQNASYEPNTSVEEEGTDYDAVDTVNCDTANCNTENYDTGNCDMTNRGAADHDAGRNPESTESNCPSDDDN